MSPKVTISKSAQQAKALRELRKENQKLRSKVKQLQSGKATLQEQLEQFKTKFARQQQAAPTLLSSENIGRHQYSELLISMCVNMYMLGGCGLRGVTRLLSYFNTTLHWGLTQLPCKSSVENWVLKAGYHLYQTVEDRSDKEKEYGIIVDECMVVGQQRMLAALSIPAQKRGSEAIGLQQVEVMHLKVKASWDGDAIKESVAAISEKMGRPPAYVVSDGSANLVSGFEKAKVERVCDVGHQLALFMEQTYKSVAEFIAFNTGMAQCRFKEVMKPTAYLLPPKQRVTARFMNLSVVVKWAEKMLGTYSYLTQEEQQVYGFVKQHQPIINELGGIIDLINEVLEVLKKEGLSYRTIAACLAKCKAYTNKGVCRVKALMNKIKAYLRQEKTKLPDCQTIWHNSSDIIESLFGFYKIRKATNALHGVTAFVLSLPLLTKLDTKKMNINLNFRIALEAVYMKDLKQWNIDHLIENQVVKRNKAFKNQFPFS